MTDWIPKILDILKLPAKLIAVLCIVSGLLLFLNDEWLQKLHVEKIESEYGIFIGVTFLVSSALLILEVTIWAWNKIRIVWLKKKLSQTAFEALQNLDTKEISVLREFYIQAQSTLQLPMSHALVASLIDKGILEQVGSLGEHSLIGPLISLKTADEVKPYITYELLDLPNGEPTEEEIQWVRNNRPEFMAGLDRRNDLHYRFGNL